MSGIAAAYHLDGSPSEPEHLGRMVRRMAHRGPDGQRIWQRGSVGLGHCMLRTTPEALEEQLPLADGDRQIVLTADVRLDNRDELVRKLGLARSASGTITDGALLLAAYARWGTVCVDHLVGPFVFAIWDASRHHLFVARDHLGVIPLYFWYEPRRLFACASEIKALFELEEVSESIDEEVLARYFTRRLITHEETVFRGVRRVPPGTSLVVAPDTFSQQTYYTPGCDFAQPEERRGWSDKDYAERFSELFTEAVRCRLRSTGSVGSELSGGLDSTYVTCVARDLMQETGRGPLHTISLIYEQFPACDERSYIDEVVPGPGLEPHFRPADQQGLPSLLRELYGFLDDGRAGGNHHLNWLTARSAKAAGVRVLLTGQDGDTTVYHGWQRFLELAYAGHWEAFAEEARQTVARLRAEQREYDMQETFTSPRDVLNAYGSTVLRTWARERRLGLLWQGASALEREFGVPRSDVLRRLIRDVVLPRRLRQRREDAAVRRAAAAEVPGVLADDLAARAGLIEALFEWKRSRPEVKRVREAQRQAFQMPQLDYSFEKMNHYAAAHGVEVRHPFMDRRLVEFCLSLPSEQSYRGGETRVIMRRAMHGVVPERVRQRAGKTSLAAPYRHLFFERDEEQLKSLVARLDDYAAYFDLDRVRALYDRREEIGDEAVRELGLALSLAIWLDSRPKQGQAGALDDAFN